MADGNIHDVKRQNRQKIIQISLKSEDKYIINLFKNELQCDNKISDYTNNNRSESFFRVSSDKMANDLSKYGVVPNKTFKLKELPDIESKFVPDLIRGIFDGDGTVYTLNNKYKSLKFGFYGTYGLIEDIINYLHEKIGLPLNKITNKGTVSFITFSKKVDIINFYNYIYYDENVICLKRKLDKFTKNIY